MLAFAPEEEAGADDDGEGYEDPFHSNLEFPEFPGVPDTLLPEEPIRKHSTANDLQRAYNLPSKHSADSDGYEPSHNMKEVPYSRFGFSNPIAPGNYKDQLRSDFCSRSVGDETWDSKDLNFILLPALFGYLSKAASLEDVPQELFDLRQDHADISGLWRGIIGHLARETGKDDLACLGPSDDAFETGVRLWDGRSQTAYWDNDLMSEEIDLICGVYVVATGLKSSADEDGVQKKTISWWPKPGAFFTSGLNIGWWSPDCERWFHKRLAEVWINSTPQWSPATHKLHVQADFTRMNGNLVRIDYLRAPHQTTWYKLPFPASTQTFSRPRYRLGRMKFTS
ncbi:hypothetical protein B0H13DRAFT_2368578 [Mycena leptocephala]|nr:hypothetical protein B0H13DRAFT_2368578 [Mycena leptocephala]